MSLDVGRIPPHTVHLPTYCHGGEDRAENSGVGGAVETFTFGGWTGCSSSFIYWIRSSLNLHSSPRLLSRNFRETQRAAHEMCIQEVLEYIPETLTEEPRRG